MVIFNPGLVHTPVTPFSRDKRIDFGLVEKLIEFHLRNGAEALAVPMHVGESVSLSDEEQRALLKFTVRQVGKRVPVIAHVSDSGTSIAAARARHAEEAGAAAIIATTPYYWTPPAAMILEHFAQIGSSVKIPFFIYYSPGKMDGTKLNMESHHPNSPSLVVQLIERLGNFAGIADASLDWQIMIGIISTGRRVRPDFQLLSGNEYMVSAGAVGATGMFSSLAGVAPQLVRRLYDICREEKYFDARKPQEEIAALRQVIKNAGPAGLKGAMRVMGRDCGEPRPPLEAIGSKYAKLAAELSTMKAIRGEPQGW